jgi:tetratricopeptide (TPR) repeat protein
MGKNGMSARSLELIGVLCLTTACVVQCLGQPPSPRERQRQSALALEQQGDAVGAEAAWRSLLATQPNSAEAYAHLGLLEARQEHYKEAITLYHKGLSLNPNFPSLRINLGLSLFKSGDLRGAIQAFEPALKTEPKSSPQALRLVTLIGMAHFGLGNYAAAIPYLKQAAAGDPENLQLRMNLAQSCLWSKQYQCVVDTYHEILSLNAESAEADMLLGEAYNEMENDAGALTEFQAAVKAGPTTPNVHFGYGYLLWKALKFDEAEKEFQAELANNPEHALSLAYLGDSEIRLKHPDDAVKDLEHAVRIQPSIPIAHLDLGILYGDQGRKDDALRELLIAVKLTPEDSMVHWRLGRFYQSVGRKEDAKAEFDKTRSLQHSKEQSLQDKLHQADALPTSPKVENEPR